MDYAAFIDYFPELSSTDEAIVSNAIRNVLLENNGYIGIEQEPVREYAIALHAAHYITVDARVLSGNPGVMKRVKSRNDEIEYAIASNQSGYDLGSTIYGIRLERLINSNYLSGYCV